MKTCSQCKILKSLDNFYKRTASLDGLFPKCIECDSLYKKEYRKKNSEKINQYNKKYYIENPIKWEFTEEARTDKKAYLKEYNKSHRSEKNKKNKIKRDNDIVYKLSELLRNRFRMALKRDSKKGSAVKDLGCSVEILKLYLESKFYEGMTWENYGEWQIDHIIPLALFDLTSREELLKACHYSNLQPLWVEDHKIKTVDDLKKIKSNKNNTLKNECQLEYQS